MRSTIVLAVLALLVSVGSSVFFTVEETEHAIVTRFGKPLAALSTPGLRWKLPWPIDRANYFDKRLLVLDLPGVGDKPKEFLTLDKKNVEVSTYTCWKIAVPLRFFEAVGTRSDAEAVLGDIVVSELGRVLGQHNLSALLSIDPQELKLAAIMEDVRAVCAALAREEYGIEVVDFRIKRVNFPDQNRTSVFERMRAERKRIATRYRSEGREEAAKIRAEADQKRTEILADANRQAREIEGRAEAEATRIYAEAYGADPEFYEFIRLLESYEQSLTKSATILMPADSPYLKLLGRAAIVSEPSGPVRCSLGTPLPTETTRPADQPDEPKRP